MSKINLKPMIDFVEDWERPKAVGAIIDEVMFEYGCKKIAECENGPQNEIVNKMATLKQLRDVFWQMEK